MMLTKFVVIFWFQRIQNRKSIALSWSPPCCVVYRPSFITVSFVCKSCQVSAIDTFKYTPLQLRTFFSSFNLGTVQDRTICKLNWKEAIKSRKLLRIFSLAAHGFYKNHSYCYTFCGRSFSVDVFSWSFNFYFLALALYHWQSGVILFAFHTKRLGCNEMPRQCWKSIFANIFGDDDREALAFLTRFQQSWCSQPPLP